MDNLKKNQAVTSMIWLFYVVNCQRPVISSYSKANLFSFYFQNIFQIKTIAWYNFHNLYYLGEFNIAMQLFYFIKKLGQFPIIQAIRNGLVASIPILLIGSFALILNSLPIPAYQFVIKNYFDGILSDIFYLINHSSFGILSLFITLSISSSYAKLITKDQEVFFGLPVAALLSFLIFSGAFFGRGSLATFGVKGMFTAIFTILTICPLYMFFSRIQKQKPTVFFVDSNYIFNIALTALFPITAIVFISAVFNTVIAHLTGCSGIHELFINFMISLFTGMQNSVQSGVLFLLLSNLMWFFGIHGSNVLDVVSTNIFGSAMELNNARIAAGLAPEMILTKTFIDVFVLMGGCGCTFSMLLAILCFSKRNGAKHIARLAFIPMLFNINEIMVFGFPIVFNPTLFIPFIAAPIAAYLISYTAFITGLVPIAVHSVEWTTPSLLGGYYATGSIRGTLLQLVIIIICTYIYKPFIIAYDMDMIRTENENLSELTKLLIENEHSLEPAELTALPGALGMTAKGLAEDIDDAINRDKFELYYQPQYNYENICFGAEALLRWKSRNGTPVYPPLVIKLANEKGILFKLEKYIITKAASEMPEVRRRLGDKVTVSANISAATVVKQGFQLFMAELKQNNLCDPKLLHIEITEQMAINAGESTVRILNNIRDMGYELEIDDFSMGSTSIKFLQSNLFHIVKLDGGIVKNIMHNERSREIVLYMVRLSHSLGIKVIAEYVETSEIRDELLRLGCHYYQGYFFSKPMPLSQLPTAKNNA